MMDDPELQELFSDPADREVIDLLKASRPAVPPLDPHFRNYLRAKLMAQARDSLATPTPTRRRWFQLGPVGMAPAMAAVAAGFIIVLGVEAYYHSQPPASQSVAVNLSGLENRKDVATAEPIQIPFSGPVDKTAVEDSIVMQPATSFTKHWDGQTLVITPAHPLAPNTTYKVTLQPKALQPKAVPQTQPAATAPPAQPPVVVHFLTAPAPVPPVVPPSFKSGSITYGYDNRIPDSARLSDPTWTLDGQLLVTRPAEPVSPTPSSSPSARATASPASAGAATNVWLMSTQGTLIRNVAPGGSYPAVAPSGGLFADWSQISDHATLEVRDLQGNVQAAAVATLGSRPDRPAVWLGPARLAYVSEGLLRVVDLHGTLISTPAIKVTGAMSASRSGLLLAMVTDAGPVLLDLTTMNTTPLPAAATGFSWSSSGQFAFTVGRGGAGTDLYAGVDPKSARKVAGSASGETWSDLNWSPDSASILLASHSGSDANAHVRLLVVNADGSSPAPFGSNQREYANPLWSPRGDLVLFRRADEAGGTSLWTAKATLGQPSAVDNAESQALAEVDKFMLARIKGDLSGAQAQLDPAAQQAYNSGASSLLSPGAQFARYYPVSVQLAGPNKFLIGARVFIARNNVETSFFEEQLTVLLQDQRYLIDAVTATPAMQLGHGPTVVSVEVRQNGPTQEILVRFDSDLKPETVSADTVLVRDNQGSLLKTRVSFDPNGHLITVEAKLKNGTYSLVVTTGVADINGTQVAQPYTSPLVIGG
jgi:hypothetical protein